MVNFVLPPLPAILPTALDKWSPLRGLTVPQNTTKQKKKKSQQLYFWVEHMYKTVKLPKDKNNKWKRLKQNYDIFLRHCTTR